MDGGQNCDGRSVSRLYESNRLEEQVWTLAYEEVWPLFCRVLNRNKPLPQYDSQAAGPSAAAEMARSA